MIFVTINTDASYNDRTGVGAYAFWIFGPEGSTKKSGVFKTDVGKAHFAEILAIGNALAEVEQQRIRFDFLVVNTDSKKAMMFFQEKHDTGTKEANYAKLIFKRLISKNKAKYKFKHVKAHQGVNDDTEGRSFVNEWCDLESRNVRRLHEGFRPLTMQNKDRR